MYLISWKRLSVLGLFAGLAAVQTGCQPEPGEAYSERKRRENEADIVAYMDQKNLRGSAQQAPSGLYYIVTKANPTGQLPAIGDQIQYQFVKSRLDGLAVDSTDNAAGKVNSVTVLERYTSDGITTVRLYEGLTKLREGEEAILLAPFDASDNKTGTLLLPAFTPVRYDVKVKSVRSEEEQILDYVAANALTNMEKTSTGLRFLLTKAFPDSAQAKSGQQVRVRYTGTLLDGRRFDSNVDNGITFRVGEGTVVKGWEETIVKLREGEKATIIIPSSLAYGTTGRRPTSTSPVGIPPYAPLRFDIELVSAQ